MINANVSRKQYELIRCSAVVKTSTLQAGGQGVESPKLLLAVKCNLLDRNSMGNWVQGRQIEIYPVPTSQQPHKPEHHPRYPPNHRTVTVQF